MITNFITDEKIEELLDEEDRNLARAGVDKPQRMLQLPDKVLERLGVRNPLFPGAPTELDMRISRLMSSLFSDGDRLLPQHRGICLLDETVGKITIPMVVGQRRIDPMAYIELPAILKKRALENDTAYFTVIDQFADVYDFDANLCPLKTELLNYETVCNFVSISRQSLVAASAAIIAGQGAQAAVQNAMHAVEMVIKALLVAQGKTEKYLKEKISHSMNKMLQELEINCPMVDIAHIRRLAESWPDYTKNRYEPLTDTPLEMATIVIHAQFAVSEIVRQLTVTNFRANASQQWKRVFPA